MASGGGGEPADALLGLAGFTEAVEIGRGGFGVVYRARQPALARDVAIKILSAAPDEATASRFDRERQVLGALSTHPAVVTVHDSGFTTSGRPYLVMELMAGGSLGDRLADSGPLPWTDACEIGVRIAGGLEAAHRLGVLHRDVKPDNILVSAYGDVKLADFGIAAVVEGNSSRTSNVTASIAHAAPEVLEGHRPSAASDVYGLASTVFALVYGRAAFRRPTDESVLPMMNRIFTEPVPDLRPTGVPAAVCDVLERAMAKRAEDRYPSAEAFAQALQDVQIASAITPTPLVVEGTASSPIVVPEIAAAVAATTAPEAQAMVDATSEGSTGRNWRRRAVPVGIAAVLLVVFAGVAAASLGGGGDDNISTRGGIGERVDDGEGAPVSETSTSTSSSSPTTVAVDVAPTTVAPPVAVTPTTRAPSRTGGPRPPATQAPKPTTPPATVTPATSPPVTAPPATAPPATAPPPTAPPPPPPPTAAITGSDVYNAGLQGFFVGESSNAVSGSWSLPGFNIADPTFEVPSDNFNLTPNCGGVGGSYTITLTVWNAAGQTASASKAFTIADPYGYC